MLWALYFKAWCRLGSVPYSAEGRFESQSKPKWSTLCGRLGSFWFLTQFTRKKSDPPNAKNRVRCEAVTVCVSLYNTENIKQMTPRTQSIFADHSPGFFFSFENQSIPIFPRLRFFLFNGTFVFFFYGGKKITEKNTVTAHFQNRRCWTCLFCIK